MTQFTNRDLFCARSLLDKGLLSQDELPKLAEAAAGYTGKFEMVEIKDDFFVELATQLRELWPAGDKDGKYSWRDSVPNLVKRLKTLWKSRNMKDYTLDECLEAARKYLVGFENNAKYMQTLKYFIFKQQKLVGHDGKVKYTYKSSLVDMLESNPVDTSEWLDAFETSNTYDHGELI